MKIGLFWRVLPAYVCVVALLSLPVWQRHRALAQAKWSAGGIVQNYSKEGKKSKYSEGVPTRIIIPRLGIDLKVVAGLYNDDTKTWSVATDSANYAINTPKPNNRQDITLIYGHATSKVFAQTKNLKNGDKVFAKTDNGHVFIYSFQSYQVLKPTDTYLFESLKTKKPKLALMTCQGLWSQERRIMYFDLKESR